MIPPAEAAVAALLLASGAIVLAAALGLWRLPDFFARMHAPALASTLAAWIVTLASIVDDARAAGVRAPAVIVVGRVADPALLAGG